MSDKRKRVGDQALQDWAALNEAVMRLDEDGVARLLRLERGGRNRLTFTLRLHARLNRLRRERERKELAR